MKDLLDELNKRLEYLESRDNPSLITEGRIAECLLTIIRVQEHILKDI